MINSFFHAQPMMECLAKMNSYESLIYELDLYGGWKTMNFHFSITVGYSQTNAVAIFHVGCATFVHLFALVDVSFRN